MGLKNILCVILNSHLSELIETEAALDRKFLPYKKVLCMYGYLGKDGRVSFSKNYNEEINIRSVCSDVVFYFEDILNVSSGQVQSGAILSFEVVDSGDVVVSNKEEAEYFLKKSMDYKVSSLKVSKNE